MKETKAKDDIFDRFSLENNVQKLTSKYGRNQKEIVVQCAGPVARWASQCAGREAKWLSKFADLEAKWPSQSAGLEAMWPSQSADLEAKWLPQCAGLEAKWPFVKQKNKAHV